MFKKGYEVIGEKKELREVGTKEIQQVMNRQAREDFMTHYRRLVQSNDKGMMDRLTVEVNKELDRQEKVISALQADIDQLSSEGEQKEAIMKIADNAVRGRMIQLNKNLFNPQPNSDEVVTTVWNERAGMYMTPEQENKERRNFIMAIKDTKERQAMIAANLHLFK